MSVSRTDLGRGILGSILEQRKVARGTKSKSDQFLAITKINLRWIHEGETVLELIKGVDINGVQKFI